ncbi:hypothetical protein POVWA2_097460 [Plasmodium ovale wallikeri]|uniref:Uncharacterized protein n=1 Tax=Plasmodium ovale wallikeri TaxID=864142 RepID=A0A1A9AS09_PLAOA|nr:hypothetical protein POVWA2_097460 [Plasmodium ovale wallikeri]
MIMLIGEDMDIAELKEIMHSPNEIIKKVGTLLYKNFNRPYSVIGNLKDKGCSDLKYSLDLEIKHQKLRKTLIHFIVK